MVKQRRVMSRAWSFSNFARNLGGSMGTAMLTTFLTRTQQTHQSALAANTGNSFAYRNYIDSTVTALMAHGQDHAAAAQEAMGRAYSTMQRQAAMLSYANAFWVLSVVIACLVPLPFVMRRPPKLTKAQADGGH